MPVSKNLPANAELLGKLPQEFRPSLDPKVMLSSLAEGTLRILHATRCSIVRVDPERHPGRAFVFTAVDDPSIDGYALDLENYPEIRVACEENRPILVRDVPDDRVAAMIRSRHRELPFPLSVVIPVALPGESFGVLFLRFADAEVKVSDEAIALCQLIAFAAAVSLRNAREHEDLLAEVRRRENEATALEDAQRLRIETLTAASHDIRAPLNGIIGYLDLLLDGAFGEIAGEPKEIVGRVLDNAHTLLQIVDTVIDHARLESAKVPVIPANGEVTRLLEELRMIAEPLVARRAVTVEFSSRGPLPTIETDWLKVKRILMNLLHNALKFTERGRVSVTAWREGEGVAFEVADEGPGIAETELAKIFTQYYRVNPAPDAGPGGLGLTIAKRYAEIVGGTLSVASRVGEGSRFTLHLPIVWRGERPPAPPVGDRETSSKKP
jgi:signal transduction histidine kinase